MTASKLLIGSIVVLILGAVGCVMQPEDEEINHACGGKCDGTGYSGSGMGLPSPADTGLELGVFAAAALVVVAPVGRQRRNAD